MSDKPRPEQLNASLQNLGLGKISEYRSEYSPELLRAVPRSLNREELGIVAQQPFSGEDIWHAYELSWLNAKGKPVVSLARFSVSASSPNLVESKSFKLYLNSFNQTRFESRDQVVAALQRDLSKVAGASFELELIAPDETAVLAAECLPGSCIDHRDIEIDDYQLNTQLLELDLAGEEVSETVHSHLLKSNCLITNQPDWASVVIEYSGPQIKHEALLRYLISFRQHNEFHEQCVERIFCDIWAACQPETLSVQALYTRRGGLDINPFRTSEPNKNAPLRRINRQ